MEDEILNRVTVEAVLAKLHPADRMMMLLIYRVEQPDDWSAQWPPRFEDIGVYIGTRYEGKPLSEAAIRYRRDAIEGQWRGRRGGLRRSRPRGDV